MISTELAKVEKGFRELIDDIDVDAVLEKGGVLRTDFISTEHDPSVGIFSGVAFTIWWKLDEGEGDWAHLPIDVKIVKQSWTPIAPVFGEKRWSEPPPDWGDVYTIILENRRIIHRALIITQMKAF